MTISYPISLPTLTDDGGIADIRIIAEHVQGRNTNPFTNAEQIYDYQAERWNLVANYVGLTPTNAKLVNAFLLSLRGIVGTFLYGDPLMASPSSIILGTPLINGSSQIGRTLNIKGLTPSTDMLKAGDYFQVGNFLYTNLKNVTADGSGNATLDIFPFVRGAPLNNDPVTLNNPKNIFRLSETTVSWTVNEERLYRVSFSAVEARA